ncbi:guanylate kinase-like [Sycon ciliatum]|uniref:guanylate kinase-like n=1 Tax=Sycon ciliatum TaxID=27933 RepID=UPI0020AD01D0|eukprot:scpid97005/ scgid26516/ Guanylate kinase; GMP kinase
MSRMPKPLVLAGPSGSGKSTLMKKLMSEYPGEFGFSVSHTTRTMRAGEKDGVDYHFTTKDEMKSAVARGEFIESAEFSGNMYGTSIKAVSDVVERGLVCLLDIDMQGVRSVKKTDLSPTYVLIKAASMEELEKRLRGRGSESEESLTARLTAAKEELDFAMQPGVFDHIVVNDELERSYGEFVGIVRKLYPHLKSS